MLEEDELVAQELQMAQKIYTKKCQTFIRRQNTSLLIARLCWSISFIPEIYWLAK